MKLKSVFAALVLPWLVLLAACGARAEAIVSAQYETPVTRYGHFALGRPHEYARITAGTDAGRKLSLELAANEVFEDLAPRLVRLESGGPTALLAIVSSVEAGARLAIVEVAGGALAITANGPPIGQPQRWLNPVGVADLDGDGRAEIAAVLTPHIGGTLKVYSRKGERLVEAASLTGFSNHVYGSPDLQLSLPVSVDGKARLLVPDTSRRQLRLVAMQQGRLAEVGRCALPAPATGGLRAEPQERVSLDTSQGRVQIALRACAG